MNFVNFMLIWVLLICVNTIGTQLDRLTKEMQLINSSLVLTGYLPREEGM